MTAPRRCIYIGCTARIAFTKSWLDGPTLHACASHESLLPQKAPIAGERQGILL